MKHLPFIALFFLQTSIMAQDNNPEKTVSITANAEMKVSPDQVVYSINISQKRSTFEQAYDALDKEINNAIDHLIKEKIKKDNIKTTAYNVQKSYRWKGDKRIDDGYTATSIIEAKNELDTRKINKVLARFAKNSPDLNLNVGFSISDELLEKSNEKLLTKAVKLAKRKALTICNALSKDLGTIHSVTYNEIGSSSPIVRQKSMMASRAMDESAEYGSIENVKEINLNLNIHTVWGIE